MNRISDDQLVVALGQQRDRIYAAWANATCGLFNLVAELHDYRDLLARCDMDEARLVQAKEELADRLKVGWDKCDTATREAFWLALLVRYEAVCDALDGPAARRRLSAWEAVHYLKHPAGPRSAATPTVARQ